MLAPKRLGLRPHDPERVARHVRLTPANAPVDPLVSTTPVDWQAGKDWDGDVMLNDQLGICGPDAWVNWLKLMGCPATVDDAMGIYEAMGYKGTPATDNGVVLMDMLQWLTNNRVAGVTMDCFFVVGFADPTHLATACQLAPLIVGANLSTACQSTNTWDNAAAGSKAEWGPHAYLYHANSPGGGNGKSWGEPVFTTPDFQAVRWTECYLPVCQELMPVGTDVLRLLNIARIL